MQYFKNKTPFGRIQTGNIIPLHFSQQIFKEINLEYPEWEDGDWKEEGRKAVKRIIEDRMNNYIDMRLVEISTEGIYDRKNGYYSRHLLTGLGDIEIFIPRTRRLNAASILIAYARRSPEIDHMILSCKVGEALLNVLGERISPSTVSRVATSLDKTVESFHKRELKCRYKTLIFDGVVLSKKTGAGGDKEGCSCSIGDTA